MEDPSKKEELTDRERMEVAFYFWLPLHIKVKFKAWCVARGVTVTDVLIGIMEEVMHGNTTISSAIISRALLEHAERKRMRRETSMRSRKYYVIPAKKRLTVDPSALPEPASDEPQNNA